MHSDTQTQEHSTLIRTWQHLKREEKLATPAKIATFKQDIATIYDGVTTEIRKQMLAAIAASEQVKRYEGEGATWKQHVEAIAAPDTTPQITLDAIKQACKQYYKSKLAEAFAQLEVTLGFVVRTDANTQAGEEYLGWHMFNNALQDQYVKESYDPATEKAEQFSWQLRLDTFIAANLAYDGKNLIEHRSLRNLENKYRKALKAMETEMDKLVDSTVDDIARLSQAQLANTDKDGYLDKVKKRRMMLIGVTAALYAVELSLALATIAPFSKGAEAIKQLTVVGDILHDRIRGLALKTALKSLPGTAPWDWYIDSPWYIRDWTVPSWSLDHNLWRHLQGLWDRFYYEEAWPNISLSVLALVGLTVAMAYTWQIMGRVSHMKVEIAKEILESIKPEANVQQKWQTAVVNTETIEAAVIPEHGEYAGFDDTSKGLEERLISLGTQLRRELEAMQGLGVS